MRTPRLRLCQATVEDAAFVLELLNEPAWRRFIGRHEVGSLDAAKVYIETRLQPGYREGLGFHIVRLAESGRALGICGLIRRPFLEAPDLGFAFLERHWGQGYAREAASAILAQAQAERGLPRVLAITVPDNTASIGLLCRLGFSLQGERAKPDTGEQVLVYARDLVGPASVVAPA